jgi:hypothetical protein
MTPQRGDEITFENELYDIVYPPEYTMLFSPQDYGLIPIAISTDCYRGYFCHFKVSSNQLFLENLSIAFENEETNDQELFEKLPEFGKWLAEYKNLNLPICYTGHLLLSSYYTLVYKKQRKYRKKKLEIILDLSIESGKVVSVANRSEQMKVERSRYGITTIHWNFNSDKIV